jgi:hypothetical protein
MLQFFDSRADRRRMRDTPLHHLADLADPFDYSTHAHIERDANVNAVSIPDGMTPFYRAYYAGNVTNDLVGSFFGKGADPNAQDHPGIIRKQKW